MKLLNLNKYLFFFIIFFLTISFLKAEDSIDIWNKDILNKNDKSKKLNTKTKKSNTKSLSGEVVSITNEINITNEILENEENRTLYGIFDPAPNNLNLDIWSETDGSEIKSIIRRIEKIDLSKSAEEIFQNVIMTYAYSPNKNLEDGEFLNMKLNWLISHNKDNLLESFLLKNETFKGKKKIIQYLVDKNIAKANLSEGCKKTNFISQEIKDPYLEKFKIYCLIFNDKKPAAQILFDILKEESKSDVFFENKINFILGITKKNNNKIKDDNLLNFYLSSITVEDFNYEPDENTNKFIWEYLNAANLINIEDIENKDKIKKFEIAANNNTLNKKKIFTIYRKIPFDLNTLINADKNYQSLEPMESRALLYQKYLLSDNINNKLDLLFLLKDLFKKEKLSNIFTEHLSNELKKLQNQNIPQSYQEIVEKNIIAIEEAKLGRVKFNDKILHRSRVIRYYIEQGTPKEKSQKDLNNVYKKIKKNKKYFFSAKDLALVESLKTDGFSIPKEIQTKEIAKKYNVPQNLLALVENNEIGLLILKFVEIIGADEISDLDPETIYFITNILNQAKLIKFRNQVLTSALPVRS